MSVDISKNENGYEHDVDELKKMSSLFTDIENLFRDIERAGQSSKYIQDVKRYIATTREMNERVINKEDLKLLGMVEEHLIYFIDRVGRIDDNPHAVKMISLDSRVCFREAFLLFRKRTGLFNINQNMDEKIRDVLKSFKTNPSTGYDFDFEWTTFVNNCPFTRADFERVIISRETIYPGLELSEVYAHLKEKNPEVFQKILSLTRSKEQVFYNAMLLFIKPIRVETEDSMKDKINKMILDFDHNRGLSRVDFLKDISWNITVKEYKVFEYLSGLCTDSVMPEISSTLASVPSGDKER